MGHVRCWIRRFVFSHSKAERSRQIGLVGPVVQDLIFYLALGLIIGGRLGYIVFYDSTTYGAISAIPWRSWQLGTGACPSTGVSSGSCCGGDFFLPIAQLPFPPSRTALCHHTHRPRLGRIGNFINGELLVCPPACPGQWYFRGAARFRDTLRSSMRPFTRVLCSSSSFGSSKRVIRMAMTIVFFLAAYGDRPFFHRILEGAGPTDSILFVYFNHGQVLCGS